jgi:UTP:GlnB (protein PII) uridylyltransferase
MTELQRESETRSAEALSGSPPSEFVESFTASMPSTYRLQYGEPVIREHAAIVWRRGSKPVHLELWSDGASESACLCLVTDDRPGLLALVSAAIVAHSLDIIGANVFGRSRRWQADEAVDFFWVRGLNGRELAPLDSREITAIADTVRALLQGDVELKTLAPHTLPASRPAGPGPCEVRFDPEATSDRLIVDAQDRPGLLSAITSALARESALVVWSKVVTLAGRAHDEFILEREDTRRLSEADKESILRAVIAAVKTIA